LVLLFPATLVIALQAVNAHLCGFNRYIGTWKNAADWNAERIKSDLLTRADYELIIKYETDF
jgi:hypothetical protein